MCSVNEDEELMKPKPKIDLVGASCRKCGVAKASVVLQSKFPYCRNCFLSYFSHKFASSLGKSKLMKHGDKVLLAFSGSQSSTCLADLIKSSMDESRRKKISTSTVLLYIEEAPLFETSVEERREILNDIHDVLLLYDFKKFYTSYDSFFDDEITLHTKYQVLLDLNESRMLKMLSDCKTETAKIDLLVKARNKILMKAAKFLQCNKIFLAETSDHLASNILSNVSLGRGGQLAVDVGFCDDRFDDILILRPLQDCSKKEVAFFNIFNELNCVTTPYFKTMDKFSSLQKLSESFVCGLQSSFPSTVSTIVSTGNKLATDSCEKENCSLCYAKIEKQSEELSAEDATLISSLVSKLGMKGFTGVNSEIQNNKSCCSSVSEDEVSKILCYGCRLVLKDFKNIEHWPSDLKNKAKEYFQMKRMESEIKEFLIE